MTEDHDPHPVAKNASKHGRSRIVGALKIIVDGVEVIATGAAIRKRKRLWRLYGKGRWRKLKGIANRRIS